MLYKTATSSKSLLAYFTLIRFLSGVSSDMQVESVLSCKALLTNFTLIRFLSGVGSDMHGQTSLLCKTLQTIFTFIWFLFGMSSDVPCNIATNTLLAIFTLKFLLCVNFADVNLKISTLIKTLLAIFALIRFLLGVSSDVPFKDTN